MPPLGRPPNGGRLRGGALSTSKPDRCQACVPFFSDTTLLGTPASISDCAPMMLRVRPPQLTITVYAGEGTRSAKRYTSSAPGTLIAPGMLLLWYSS